MTLLTHMIQPGQTRIILYPGLTQMTWTKRDLDDPGDPTWFQHWHGLDIKGTVKKLRV